MPLPLVPLISLGLSLLPKLPAAWGAIAGLFGKKVPETITEAGNLAEEVLGSLKTGNLSPEVQIEMEKIFKSHEQVMANITLEERKIEMTGILGAQEVEKASYKSEDPFVRQTRPLILRRMCNTLIAYVFICLTALIIMCYVDKFTPDDITLVMGTMKEYFLYLGGVFSIAFTGYTVVRSQEKKAGVENANGETNGGLLKGFNPFGKK